MRYAIVIERANGSYSPTCPIFQAASQLATLKQRSNQKFVRLSNFT